MCEWGSATVAILLAFASAFMTVLLAWYRQGQTIAELNGRVVEVEKAEKNCLEREANLRERVTRLELTASTPPPKPKRRKRRTRPA